MKKGLRIFGHPVHAILSAFPIALLSTSVLWDVIGIWRAESIWWAISFWNIALGLGIATLATMAGAVDYSTIDQKDPAIKVANFHIALMSTVLLIYGIALFVRGGQGVPTGNTRIAVIALEALGLILVSAGGWFGGHLVFHHGIGRDQSVQ